VELGGLADLRAVGPLTALLTGRATCVRRHVIQALGEMGGLRAVKPPPRRLSGCRDAGMAAQAYGLIAHPGAWEGCFVAIVRNNTYSGASKGWTQRSFEGSVHKLLVQALQTGRMAPEELQQIRQLLDEHGSAHAGDD
jgi:hypothetical protein